MYLCSSDLLWIFPKFSTLTKLIKLKFLLFSAKWTLVNGMIRLTLYYSWSICMFSLGETSLFIYLLGLIYFFVCLFLLNMQYSQTKFLFSWSQSSFFSPFLHRRLPHLYAHPSQGLQYRQLLLLLFHAPSTAQISNPINSACGSTSQIHLFTLTMINPPNDRAPGNSLVCCSV